MISICKRLVHNLLILLTVMLLLQGCGTSKDENVVTEKIYTYSGETFSKIENDYFRIAINEDGTFNYCESALSSHIGFGEWSITDDILTLSEDEKMGYPLVNYFLIDGNDLIFIEENSSNFIYVTVKDGERFVGAAFSNDNK